MYIQESMMIIDVKLVKIGNSLSFRVPKIAADRLHLSDGSIAELEVENNELIFRPKKKYVLKDLLKKITPQNIHTEQGLGNEIGKEVIDE
jgi:antitoxin MazE